MSFYSLSIKNLYLNSLSMMNLHNHGIDGDMQVFAFLLAFVLVLALVFILFFCTNAVRPHNPILMTVCNKLSINFGVFLWLQTPIDIATAAIFDCLHK